MCSIQKRYIDSVSNTLLNRLDKEQGQRRRAR